MNYFTTACPACQSENLIDAGDPNDCTSCAGERFRCWACKTACELPLDAEDMDGFVVADNQDGIFTDADPPPRWTRKRIAEAKKKAKVQS